MIFFPTNQTSTSTGLDKNPDRMNVTIETHKNGRPKIDAGLKFEIVCNFNFKPDMVYWTWQGFSLFHVNMGRHAWSTNYLYDGMYIKFYFFIKTPLIVYSR